MRKVLALCVAVAGCGDNELPPIAESQHIRLFVEPGFPYCDRQLADALGFLDGAAVAAAEFLDVELTRPIDYHLIAPQLWPGDSPCQEDSTACESGGDVWAMYPLPHEIVHAVEYQAFGGNTVSFFAEGLAEALGSDPYMDAKAVDVDFDVELGKARIDFDVYDDAGEFVSYLLATYGAASWRRFAEHIMHGTSAPDVRAAFVAEYGKSVEAMRDEHAQRGLNFAGTLGLATCSALPRLAWQNGIREDRALGCEQGAFEAVFDVPETTAYRLDYQASLTTYVNVRRCPFGFGAEAPLLFGDSNYSAPRQATLAYVPVGRYHVYTSYVLEGTRASFEMTRDSSSCADAIAFDDLDRLTIVPGAGVTRRVSLTTAVERNVELKFGVYVPVAPAICESCSGPCQAFADRARVTLGPTQSLILELTGAIAQSYIKVEPAQ